MTSTMTSTMISARAKFALAATLSVAFLLLTAAKQPLHATAPATTATSAPSPEAAPIILIQNATILTISHGTIEHGSILIKDGKIAEVAPSIKAPANAQVIDANGQFVMPGICLLYTSPSPRDS